MATSRDTINTRIALEGGREVVEELRQIGERGENAFRQIGTVGQEAGRQVQGAFDQVSGSMDRASSTASRFLTILGGVAAGAAALGLAANAAIGSMLTAGARAATELTNAAEKVGLSVTQYQQLTAVLENGGADAARFMDSLGRLGKVAAESGKAGVDAARAWREVTVTAEDGSERIIRVFGGMQQAAGRWETVSKEVNGVTLTFRKFISAADAAKSSGHGVADALQRLGVNTRAFAQADPAEQFRMLAEGFAKITSEQERGTLAQRLWGDQWRANLATVTQSAAEQAAAVARMKALGRDLSESETANLKAYGDAQKDLQSALDATRQRIAALFAPTRTASTQWLTELIDTNREWLLQLLETKRVMFETFFRDRGRPFIEAALERIGSIARDVGDVLSTLVAPTVRAIGAAFDYAAEKINEFFGTDISGQFLAIAVAIGSFLGVFGFIRGAITIVTGAFGLVITALTTLRGLFVTGGLGAAAFWMEIRAGAVAAFTAIRGALPALRAAMAAAFRGDFATAFTILRAQALEAFAGIRAAVLNVRGPIGQMLQNLKTAFNVVMTALNGVARVLNAVFGTNLTGASLAFYMALLQMAGVFTTLGAIIVPLVLVFSRLNPLFLLIAGAAIILVRLFGQMSDAWTKLSEGFSNLLNGNFAQRWEQLKAAASDFWNTLTGQSAMTWAILIGGAAFAVARIIAIFGTLGPALMGIAAFVGPIGAAMVTALSTAVTALAPLLGWPALLAVAVGAAVAAIIAYWPEISTAFMSAWTSMLAFAREEWEKFKADLGTIGDTLGAAWQEIGAAWSREWEQFKSEWNSLVEAMRGLWNSFADYVLSAINNLASSVSSIVSTIMSAVSSIGSAIVNAVSGAFSGAEPNGGGPVYDGYASGGYIRGRGTSRSDSIPIRASNGEYMINAAAVQHYGVRLFDLLNRMALAPGYAAGGLIESLRGSMASFGASRSLAPVSGSDFAFAGASDPTTILNLTIGGATFEGLIAPRAVAEKLARFALTDQVASAGRLPGNR